MPISMKTVVAVVFLIALLIVIISQMQVAITVWSNENSLPSYAQPSNILPFTAPTVRVLAIALFIIVIIAAVYMLIKFMGVGGGW